MTNYCLGQFDIIYEINFKHYSRLEKLLWLSHKWYHRPHIVTLERTLGNQYM